MRCKGKDAHEMSDGQKFCAACGSAAEETLAKAVCGGCHAEGAGDQKFCAHCGEPLAKAADFDAGMAALEDLYTTTRQSPDELSVEEHSWGTPQVGDLLKGQGADGVIDAAPVLDAVLESANRVADQVVAGNRQSVKLERALGVIAKAIVTVVRPLMAEVQSVRNEMQTQGNQRLPRRGQVELVHKAIPDVSGDQADETPRGEFLWKSACDFETEGLLEHGDATMTQSYANAGHSVRTLAQENPPLARRLATTFQRKMRAA